MNSLTYNDEYKKKLENQLEDIGKKLTKLPSGNDELLALLETAEAVLSKVWQEPPQSTATALFPITQAMVAHALLRHSDENVRIVVASCLDEITRIAAPDAPYPNDLMMEIFRLFMEAFKYLPNGSGSNFLRAYWILKSMATLRYGMIMLDMEMDELVAEMFQLFLDIVKMNNSDDTVKYMEIIMTMMINESDEVSIKLLKPLLDIVKMENKDSSPAAWELGKIVFEKCAVKLPSYLREAVKLMNVNVDEYDKVVASICKDTSNGENMVAEEVVVTGSLGDGVSAEKMLNMEEISKVEQENFTHQSTNENESILDNENSTKTLKFNNDHEGDNARSNDEVVNIRETRQPETEIGGFRGRRGRKPNTLMRPEEGYEHSWMTGWSVRQRSRSYKKENTMILDNDPEQPVKPRRKVQKSGVMDTRTKMPSSGTNSDDKAMLLVQELSGRKDIDDEIISQQCDSEDDDNKMVGSLVSKPATEDSVRKKEKESGKSHVHYAEKLVKARISVWWPLDKAFYTGTIESFDPLTNTHKIKYDDDEEEILNLEEERWEFFKEKKSHQLQTSSKQEADNLSCSKKPDETEKKTSKRRIGSSTPQWAASSSKREKIEGRSFLKSGKSTFRYINLNEGPDDDSF